MNCYYRAEIGVVLAKNGPPWAENGPPGPPGDPPWDPPGPKMGQKSVSEEALLHIKYPYFWQIWTRILDPQKDDFHDFDTFWEKTPKSVILALQMTF